MLNGMPEAGNAFEKDLAEETANHGMRSVIQGTTSCGFTTSRRSTSSWLSTWTTYSAHTRTMQPTSTSGT